MKKIFLISILIFIMFISISVFANDIQIDDNETSKEVEVIYGVAESFDIVIPPDFYLYGTQEAQQIVKASNVYINYGKVLKISVSSENYSNGWYLLNNSDPTIKASYTIGRSSGASDVTATDNVVLEVEAGNVEGVENTLYFRAPVFPMIKGVYQDTLNFTVSVDDIVSNDGID